MRHVLVGGMTREHVLAERLRKIEEEKRASQGESLDHQLPKATTWLDDLLFTELSTENVTWPDAVTQSAQTVNGLDYVMWSAREAAQYRIGKKDPNAEGYLLTRTAVLYFMDNGNPYAAFDDLPHPQENIILTRAQKGYDSYKKHNTWFLPKNDPIIAGALARATSSKRIIKIKAQSGEWKYSVVPGSAGSEFGKAKVNHMIFGAEVAESYASWIHNHKDSDGDQFQYGHAFLLNELAVEKLNLPSGMVEVRPVSLGGGHNNVICDIYALEQLDRGGLAAGVAYPKKSR